MYISWSRMAVKWIFQSYLKPWCIHSLGERMKVGVTQSRTMCALPGIHKVLTWALSVVKQVISWSSQLDMSLLLHRDFVYFGSTLDSNQDNFCLLGWCLRVKDDLLYYGRMGPLLLEWSSCPWTQFSASTFVNILKVKKRAGNNWEREDDRESLSFMT